MLERDGTIVRILAKELGWLHGQKLVWVPPFGCDRGVRVSRHVIPRRAVHTAADQSQRGCQQFLCPKRLHAIKRRLDQFHSMSAMNSIENRLVIAHLFG